MNDRVEFLCLTHRTRAGRNDGALIRRLGTTFVLCAMPVVAIGGIAALALSLPTMSWLAVPVAAAWLGVALWLGRAAARVDRARVN